LIVSKGWSINSEKSVAIFSPEAKSLTISYCPSANFKSLEIFLTVVKMFKLRIAMREAKKYPL
jgi:hypothetical protein